MKLPFIIILSTVLAPVYGQLSEPIPFPVKCESSLKFGDEFIDLNCTNGYCYGVVKAEEIRMTGKCPFNIDYNAYANLPPFNISGKCINNSITIQLNSKFVQIAGLCVLEDVEVGSFEASINSPILSASGYCQPTGMIRIFLNGSQQIINGHCRSK